MATLLIVDDSEVSRDIIKQMLKDEEAYTIVGEAADGAEGLKKFKELRPDITTLDITMPVMDGIEALKQIMDFDPDAKVIMVSSSAQENKISEALILGAFEFLPKPLERHRLLETMEEILASV